MLFKRVESNVPENDTVKGISKEASTLCGAVASRIIIYSIRTNSVFCRNNTITVIQYPGYTRVADSYNVETRNRALPFSF